MSNMKNRLEELEERTEIELYRSWKRRFEIKSGDELEFYSVHGKFPEAAIEPYSKEIIFNGWKTTVTLERLKQQETGETTNRSTV